jgi:hypothetical protein
VRVAAVHAIEYHLVWSLVLTPSNLLFVGVGRFGPLTLRSPAPLRTGQYFHVPAFAGMRLTHALALPRRVRRAGPTRIPAFGRATPVANAERIRPRLLTCQSASSGGIVFDALGPKSW